MRILDIPLLLIKSETIISFSGGRTSAMMLKLILDAHGGTLPLWVKVVFCNTGKERPETLDFVNECAKRWNDGNHLARVPRSRRAFRSMGNRHLRNRKPQW
jgi:3'-phosphoadenosine 5'-phosphosulfate sulfotransferase (PAPS reductase)/FAD synthetase